MNLNNKDKSWVELKFHDDDKQQIVKPNEIKLNENNYPPKINNNDDIVNCIRGSIFGMAIGDALGAHVEFRPRDYLKSNPVKELRGGGTWGLEKGQFTDDTSMALCLANSLIAHEDFIPYDQLMRYKWWYRHGYMSSTGHCFDIGSATRQSIQQFEMRQREFAEDYGINLDEMDYSSNPDLFLEFNVYCSQDGVAGNGALMRLAPVPLFFYRDPIKAVEYSGISGKITHGDNKAYDACRYYGALIVAALHGIEKEDLLKDTFYDEHKSWFGEKNLHNSILTIAKGSFKKPGGYDQGIRGKGYIVNALEAALWAFWSDQNSFEIGVLNAVNLGDDTDTTAAIYGQLAGVYYGYKQLPDKWLKYIYAKDFLLCVSDWIAYDGYIWFNKQNISDDILKSLINSNPINDISNTTIKSNSKFYSSYNYQYKKKISIKYDSMKINRKAIDNHGRIGSFYDIIKDSIVDISCINFDLKNNTEHSENKCIIIKGDQIEGQNILKYLNFDDELRLSLISNIIPPSGISLVMNYPYLIDENTRILYYSYQTRHEGYPNDLNQIKKRIQELILSNKQITHIITGIDIGIDIIILFRLTSNDLNKFDENINQIKDSFIKNTFLNDNILFKNNNISINIYSNIDYLNQQKTFSDIYHSIYKIRQNLNDYQPSNYILQPIQLYLTDNNDNFIDFNPIRPMIIQKIEQYLFQFSWINKMWSTTIKDDKLYILKQYFNEQLHDIENKLSELKNKCIEEKIQFEKFILNIRQGKASQDTIEDYLSNDKNSIKLKETIDKMISLITNLNEKSILIDNLTQKKFIYQKANDYNIQSNDNQKSIEKKLFEKNSKTYFLCSNDFLNNNNISQLDQLSTKLLNQAKLNQNFKLIYLDFTDSLYELDQIQIYPLDNHIDQQNQHTYLLSTKKEKPHYPLSINEKNINILLLGKSGVGKSTLINSFIDYFQSNFLKNNLSIISLPRIIISFTHFILSGNEEHIVHFGIKDSNEDYDHPDQSITRQCKLYNFNLNNNLKLCFIDTPGFGKTNNPNNDDITMQHILSSIINLTHLTAICVLIDSNEIQFDNYQTCLTGLFQFLGNDAANNIVFCFTKSLSETGNSNIRNSSIKLMVESLHIPNIDFNEENIFNFDSTFFINSTVSHRFASPEDVSSIISEQSWNISKNGWDRLIHYVKGNLDPYIIEQSLEKAKLSRFEIKQLIRPLLETLRNTIRNIILFKSNCRNCSIELHPKSLLYPSAICYSCKRNPYQCNQFWILPDCPHEYRDICYTCSCTPDKHIRIDYRIEYKNNNNNQSREDLIPIHDLLDIITNLSYFLLERNFNTNDDLFLIYLNRIIDEERYILENISSCGFNLNLYGNLMNFKYKYQRIINKKKEGYLQNNLDIDDLIENVKQVPIIKIQLDIAKKIQEISV